MKSPGLGRGVPPGTSRAPWRRAMASALSVGATAFLLGGGCGGHGASAPTPLPIPTPTPSPKIVILSVDGLRGDAIGQAAVPNILGLARRGAYTWKAQTVFPSITLPAHASMLTGFIPAAHGITWDEYKPERGRLAVPTIFVVAKAAGLRTVLVAGKEKFRTLDVDGALDAFVLTARGDADVANEAIVQVQAGFDLMFVHFPDVDITGHAKGWLSAPYLDKVAAADEAIGRLLRALPPQTTIIFTADHGGRATTHGSAIPEDMTIPWVVAGPRIPARGHELTRPVRTIDTAATALYVLGVSPVGAATGIVVNEAFVAE